MITHVVMWKFKPDTEADQERFLTGLKGLFGVIPEIKAQEVHRSAVPDSEYDALFRELQELEVDPRHVAVSEICKSIRVIRSAFDFEEA